ncbi:hypothetical protein AMS68_004609 [Peltaster fructicola]|uniref:Mitochondrial ATPase inhibitor n=1 Tax=Peltaster fructicola TaxID=286661 RepID=A0A6H0XWE5_9PEZI|nr:hypothetical protein AMS68_004609 [Peltaster fructicola]
MSAIRQSLTAARRAPRFVQQTVATRSFVASRQLRVSKETDLHHEGRQAEIEREHQKKNDGQWNDSLASDSESIAKADRGELQGGEKTISQLQDETAKLANQQKLDELEKLKKH